MLTRIFFRVQFDNESYPLVRKETFVIWRHLIEPRPLRDSESAYLWPWIHVLVERLFFFSLAVFVC